MTTQSTNTAQGSLQGAWDALMNGDTAERDRLCDRAKVLAQAEQYAFSVEKVMSVDFYVTTRGKVIPTKMMAKAAGAIQ